MRNVMRFFVSESTPSIPRYVSLLSHTHTPTRSLSVCLLPARGWMDGWMVHTRVYSRTGLLTTTCAAITFIRFIVLSLA
jgi:hypothetical protein